MRGSERYDVAIVGGGIVGLATASALLRSGGLSVVVLESEARLAAHQSGRNSGVIHSGLYYRPGSLKARHCVEGRRELYNYCAERGVPHRRCGKLVVATREEELPFLGELERRGRANGLRGLERLDAAGARAREPAVACLAALWVPDTGVVDFAAVTRALAAEVQEAGGDVRTRCRVSGVRRRPRSLALRIPGGVLEVAYLINCAGLQADRVARLCGTRPGIRIVPFRGDFHRLRAGRRHLVRGLIYPVPHPDFPFLGVHLTRTVTGEVEAGPNALLALSRHGYRRGSFSPRDALEILLYPGFWRLILRHWRLGARELRRSLHRRSFAAAVRNLVPELSSEDLEPGGRGIRAQALDPAGRLLDDFYLVGGQRSLHVLNAPSPAATASLSIGRRIAREARERLERC